MSANDEVVIVPREEFQILLSLLIMFAAAKVGGELFLRLRQPVVIGELLVGALIGIHGLGLVPESAVTDAIAELGVIILLFMVGLETRVGDLVEVGWPAILVGIFGVLVPLAAGFVGFSAIGFSTIQALVMATAMVATSVGITVRVLGDMGLIRHRISRIILGAAILDDILGLLVLALVSNLARPGFNYLEFVLLVAEAVFFVLFLTWFGPRVAGRHLPTVSRLRIAEAPFAVSIIMVLGFSVLAEYIGLAAIIGAFLAGIVLSEAKEFLELEEKFKPVGDFLIPFFFVVMGTKFDVPQLLQPTTLLILAFAVVLAVVSKLLGSAIGTWGLGWRAALQTGVGMVPRGEVGIVVGTLGLALGVINQNLYGVILGVSIVTTLIAPPLLGIVFRGER